MTNIPKFNQIMLSTLLRFRIHMLLPDEAEETKLGTQLFYRQDHTS
jgi:hypothetical protein